MKRLDPITLNALAAELRGLLSGDVELDLPLAPLTTYRLGGSADLALMPNGAEDLALALGVLRRRGAAHVVLGGGSNVLVSDGGVREVVVITTGLAGLAVKGRAVVAGAGVASHQVALAAREAGLTGAEFLAWLPGSIGGACLMNARAHGGEISGVLREARVVAGDGRLVTRSLAPLDFSYKDSPFRREGLVVAEATFELEDGDAVEIQRRMDHIERARRGNHEMDHPSCGCVFKNDYSVGISSGQLIDRCGLKGLTVGGASVSPHHANFVLNNGSATAEDVRQVIEQVQRTVLEQTGHRLALEVQLLGEWG